jgi:hypothetical protein
MAERSYWYVATTPLSVPHWTEVTSYETEVRGERVLVPMLFTTREKAEAELRSIVEGEADAYLQAVGEYGEKAMNAALDNTPEHQVFEIEAWLLGEHLKDSDVTYVVVDDRMWSAGELQEELGS